LWFGYGADADSGGPVGDRSLYFELGVWLPKKAARMLDERKAFKEQLTSFESDFDDQGWIFARAPASRFIGNDPGIDAQARRIAAWAVPTVGELLSLKPGARRG
jgi:hypothetical protein